MSETEKVLISACLIGEPVRYNGSGARRESKIVDDWVAQGRTVPLCPEVLGGLSVPRPRAEIIGRSGFAVLDGFAVVIDSEDNDVTFQFLEGARMVLNHALAHGIRVAVLKDGSPSCGRSYIYNGQFRGIRKRGEPGVTAALLQRNGITVFCEHELEQADQRLRELERMS